MAGKGEIIVIGGGLAGLGAVVRIAEMGYKSLLVSLVPVKRSHSVCAQGGINGAVNTKGEGDSPEIHFYDTVKGGDFLADQPHVKDMCYAAPGIIYLMDRMGVTFNRTPEGLLDFRRFGGTLYNRTAFAGATTGQQLLYALDEQVRRYEDDGLVEKFEHHEFMSSVLDEEGRVRGAVIMDHHSMELQTLKADAVINATGGPGLIFGKSTNSMICTGGANGRCYEQGAIYSNAEFIQVHPTAIPGLDKLRLMSESARGEGGRVWTYKDGKPWYFLEERYPKFGNLVPRDIASREILGVCRDGLGVDGQYMVYLDLSHIPAEELDRKLGGILSIYEKFVGDDPRKVPMKIFPAVHYSMGGLWFDWPDANEADRFRQMTNVPGLFVAGESDYGYHGANRLGANSLLSCIFGGFISGPSAVNYLESLNKSYADVPERVFEAELKKQTNLCDEVRTRRGDENVFALHKDLAKIMTDKATVFRNDKGLKEAKSDVMVIKDRYKKVQVDDGSRWANQAFVFAHQLKSMIEVAQLIVEGALNRTESRGAHAREDHIERDDKNWMKTTMGTYTPEGPKLDYKEVDNRHYEPVLRSYK